MNKIAPLMTVAAVISLFSLPVFAGEKPSLELFATKTNTTISIDGQADDVWDKAKPLTVKLDKLPYKPNNGYKGMKETDISLRALYDDKHIYFLVEYADPTESLQRFPWIKQADGTWKITKELDDTGHDNTYYEDKVSFFWNINNKGFKKKGCDKACHMKDDDGLIDGVKDKSPGRKYTKPGETIDMWHWKTARTNPVGQMDDQFVNSDRQADHKSWGRHGDAKTGGGYSKNVSEDKSTPMYLSSEKLDSPYYLIKGKTKPFKDEHKVGDEVGSMVLSPFTGSRGDIAAKGVWKSGRWVLEIKRALVTTGEKAAIQDVQFNDLKKPYYFGVTVFDNSQINHIYHKKALKLYFNP